MTLALARPEATLTASRAQHDEYRLLTALDSEPQPFEDALTRAGFKAEGEPVSLYHRHLLYQATRQYQTARYTERKGVSGLVITGIGEARRHVLESQLRSAGLL